APRLAPGPGPRGLAAPPRRPRRGAASAPPDGARATRVTAPRPPGAWAPRTHRPAQCAWAHLGPALSRPRAGLGRRSTPAPGPPPTRPRPVALGAAGLRKNPPTTR